MRYHIEFSKEALKVLSKLDKYTQKMILNWLDNKLENCTNPRIYGKALKANLNGLWRYRIGDYRIICNIEDNKLVILIITIGHRKEVYLTVK